MLAPQTIDSLIIKDSALRGGRPIIAGTGVTVRTIVGYYKLGYTPEAIGADFSSFPCFYSVFVQQSGQVL